MMGLDVSHGCWSGAYSAFHRWRSKLAEVCGIPLELMEGFWHQSDTITAMIKRMLDDEPIIKEILDKNLPISWSILKPDVIHILLNHSDCDGVIEHKYCKDLADRLEDLLPLLPDGEGGGHIGNWQDKTQRFIDGLRLAWDKCEDIEFC